jgi:hypothetical protein
MSINFNWVINSIDSYPSEANYLSSSYDVNWTCTGTCSLTASNLNVVEYTASESGITSLTIDSGSVYIPYENLVHVDVLDTVYVEMGVEGVSTVEANISASIQQQSRIDTDINFQWSVVALESYPIYDSYENVIFNVHWDCKGTHVVSGSGTYTSNSIGVQELTFQSGSVFVSYDDLEQDIVIGWVKYAMGDNTVNSIKTNISASIADKIHPRILKLPLPWGS